MLEAEKNARPAQTRCETATWMIHATIGRVRGLVVEGSASNFEALLDVATARICSVAPAGSPASTSTGTAEHAPGREITRIGNGVWRD